MELLPQLGTSQEKTASRRQRGLGSRFKEDTSGLGETSLALGLVSRDTAGVSQQGRQAPDMAFQAKRRCGSWAGRRETASTPGANTKQKVRPEVMQRFGSNLTTNHL